jgi:hypothetical protein
MRGLLVASVVLVAGLLAAPAAARSAVTVQSSSTPATPADAAPFLGDWTLTLQGPNGPGAFDLTVKTEEQKVVGEISVPTGEMPKNFIPDVAMNDKTMELRYSFDYQGNNVPAVVSLTPAADGKINAQIDFAGGAYLMTGTAAKKTAVKP